MALDRDKIAKNALKYIQRGQYRKAIDEYKRVLSMDPSDIRTRLKLIDVYGRGGMKKEAVSECLQVAEVYSDQGFFLKAIAVLKQALRIDPEDTALYIKMGEMYIKQGLVGDALNSFKMGVGVMRKQNRASEATELLERMEELAPENAAIKIHLAEIYLEETRYDAFESELTKLVLQLKGEGRSGKLLRAVESFYSRSNHHPIVLKRLAELYVDLGEDEKALDVIVEGLAVEPSDRDLRLLCLRANLVLSRLPEARRIALTLYEEDPEDLFILEQLIAIAQARGDDAELVHGYKCMAKVYANRGLKQKEEFYYKKVMELSEKDAEARLALGEVTTEPAKSSISDLSSEDIVFGSSEAQRQELKKGLFEAELYIKYGLDEKAEQKLNELTGMARDDIKLRQMRRDICRRRGDREGWIREQLLIAEIFQRENRDNEALKAFQSIVEIDPQNKEAKRAIQYLKPEMAEGAFSRQSVPIDTSAIQFVQEEGGERVVREIDLSVGEETDEQLQDSLAEADFYEAQSLVDEAVGVLLRMKNYYPDSPQVLSRLQRLGWKEEKAGAESFVDLQSEVLEAADFSISSGIEGFKDFEVSELDDIVQEFKSGISDKLDENDFETHYNLGVAYREMGLMDDAVQEFQVAARSTGKARDAFASIAAIYREQSMLKDASAALRMALAVPGNSADDRAAILYEMGALAEEEGDWEGALRLYEKTASLSPNMRNVNQLILKLKSRTEG